MSVQTGTNPRIQTRQTSQVGDPVTDDQWTVICDTGPIATETTPVPPVTAPAPAANVDVFGIQKIYGDAAQPCSNWTMNMQDPGNDPRTKNPETSGYPPKFIKNSDGSWKIKDQVEIRWAVTQNNGFHQDKLCTDFVKCTQQGFMQDSMDWGVSPGSKLGLELTQYIRINAVGSGSKNGEPHCEAVMLGQRSTTSDQKIGPCNCALGCSFNYHGNIYNSRGKTGPARQKWECDLKHTSGYKSDISGVNNNSAYNFKLGQFQGFKTIVYVRPDGATQLEHWTDEQNTNSWKKTHSFLDDGKGGWQPRQSAAGCNVPKSPNNITFGGPICCIRSDNLTDYDLKNCSIRTVDPSKPLMATAHAHTAMSTDEANPEDVILQRSGEEGSEQIAIAPAQ